MVSLGLDSGSSGRAWVKVWQALVSAAVGLLTFLATAWMLVGFPASTLDAVAHVVFLAMFFLLVPLTLVAMVAGYLAALAEARWAGHRVFWCGMSGIVTGFFTGLTTWYLLWVSMDFVAAGVGAFSGLVAGLFYGMLSRSSDGSGVATSSTGR